MSKVLFLGDEGYLSQLFNNALQSSDELNFEYEFYSRPQTRKEDSQGFASLLSKIDVRRWRTSHVLREKLIAGSIDHIHCLSPDLVDQDLFTEVGITYSVSCPSNPLVGVVDATTIERVAKIRQSEFVICNSEWMALDLANQTGISKSRIHNGHWPVPFTAAEQPVRVRRQGVLVVTEKFNSYEDEWEVLEKLDRFCAGEYVTIISSQPCPIEDVVGFQWYQLNPLSQVLAQLMEASKIGIIPEATQESSAILIHMLAAGLPVVSYKSEDISELVLHRATGLMVEGSPSEFDQAVRLVIDSFANQKTMSDNSKAYYHQKFQCRDSIAHVGDLISGVLEQPDRSRRIVIDLIDGIEIGREQTDNVFI